MKVKMTAALLAVSFAAVACSKPEEEVVDNTTPETETAETTTPAPPVTQPEPVEETLADKGPFSAFAAPASLDAAISFDGETFEETTFDPPLPTYVIDMVIVSGDDVKSGAPTDDTPSMPMAATPGAVYVTEDGYLFSGDILRDVSVTADKSAPVRFTLINASEGAALLANGEVVWEGSRVQRLGDFKFGAGFKERTWTGNAQGVQIVEIALDDTLEGVLSEGLGDRTVLFELGE